MIANKTDAINSSYGICHVIDVSRLPSPDSKRSTKRYMKAFAYVLLALTVLLGCGQRDSISEKPRVPDSSVDRLLTSRPELKEFSWGLGQIVLGMSKADVVKEIELTWKRPEKDPFEGISMPGIDRVKDANLEQDTWILSFGAHTGHAPGGGHVQLEFSQGKLSRILLIATMAG